MTAGCEFHFMANQISLLNNLIVVFIENVVLAIGRQCIFVASGMHIRFNGKKSYLNNTATVKKIDHMVTHKWQFISENTSDTCFG